MTHYNTHIDCVITLTMYKSFTSPTTGLKKTIALTLLSFQLHRYQMNTGQMMMQRVLFDMEVSCLM